MQVVECSCLLLFFEKNCLFVAMQARSPPMLSPNQSPPAKRRAAFNSRWAQDLFFPLFHFLTLFRQLAAVALLSAAVASAAVAQSAAARLLGPLRPQPLGRRFDGRIQCRAQHAETRKGPDELAARSQRTRRKLLCSRHLRAAAAHGNVWSPGRAVVAPQPRQRHRTHIASEHAQA